MITTHLPTTATRLAWAFVLGEAFATHHPRTARAMRRYNTCRPETRRDATRAAYRYADLEVARRLNDHDQAVDEDQHVDVTTAFFFLHAVNRDLIDCAAAELAAITESICTGPLTWDAVFPDDSVDGAQAAGLIAPEELPHATWWLRILQRTPTQDLFDGPDPLAQGLSLRDAQALLVLAVLAARSLPDAPEWIQRRQAHRAPRSQGRRCAPIPT